MCCFNAAPCWLYRKVRSMPDPSSCVRVANPPIVLRSNRLDLNLHPSIHPSQCRRPPKSLWRRPRSPQSALSSSCTSSKKRTKLYNTQPRTHPVDEAMANEIDTGHARRSDPRHGAAKDQEGATARLRDAAAVGRGVSTGAECHGWRQEMSVRDAE